MTSVTSVLDPIEPFCDAMKFNAEGVNGPDQAPVDSLHSRGIAPRFCDEISRTVKARRYIDLRSNLRAQC
jgi:hypothetical protein